MLDLKKLQQYRNDNTSLPLRITENYPATLSYRVELARNSEKLLSKYGIFYSFTSTGARSTISDYSGRCDLDAVITGNEIGITFDILINQIEFPAYGIYCEAGYIFTWLKTTDYVQLVYPEEYEQSQSYRFKTGGLASEAGLFLHYIIGHFKGRINLGYLLDFSGNLHLPSSRENVLSLNNKVLKPKWNGIRLGVQLDIIWKSQSLKPIKTG